MAIPSRKPRLSRRKKACFALVTTIGFFLLLEGALAVLGVGTPIQQRDPWVGFSSYHPLFEASNQEGITWLSTADNKHVWFNSQSFPRNKRQNTKRAFSVGGSTTYGRPYRDLTSYTGWLREFLPLVDTEHHWEVINAGGVSYASYRVAAVMEELAKYDPDLFIVYTGHNEFLERRTYAAMFEKRTVNRLRFALSRTRTWNAMERILQKDVTAHPTSDTNSANNADGRDVLPAEVDEELNHTVGPVDYHRDPQWQQDVLKHYRLNLDRMVAIAKSCGAEIVFVTPASNERNCSPFKSEFSSDTNAQQRQAFLTHVEQAERFSQAEQFSQAEAEFRAALTIDKLHALTHYRLGQILFKQDRMEEADRALRQAIELDVCPLRASESILAAVRALPSKHPDVHVVDFDKLLRAQCQDEFGHACLGEEHFVDHVHPTVDAHRQLGLWLVDQLRSTGAIPDQPLDEDDISKVTQQVLSKIDIREQGVALRNLAKVFHWAGKFEEAAPHAERALEKITDDAESLFILADCRKHAGRTDEAISLLEHLLSIHPDYHRAAIPLGVLLVQADKYKRAEPHLILGLLANPNDAYGHYWLGLAHLGMKEPASARQALQESNAIFPNDPSTLYYLGQACAELGATDNAIKHFRDALKIAPHDAATHNYLGWILLERHQTAEAIEHFLAAVKADPDYEEAKANLIFAQEMVAPNPPLE